MIDIRYRKKVLILFSGTKSMSKCYDSDEGDECDNYTKPKPERSSRRSDSDDEHYGFDEKPGGHY